MSSNRSVRPQPMAPAPTPKEISTFVDEITGTSFGKETSPTGEVVYRKGRLPRSPGQQQLFQMAEAMLNESFENIKNGINSGTDLLPLYTNYINLFSKLRQEQKEDLNRVASLANFETNVTHYRNLIKSRIEDQHYKERVNLEEELSRRGLSNSTEAEKRRAALATRQAKDLSESEVEAELIAKEAADRSREYDLKGYHERQMGREAELALTGQEFEVQDAIARRQLQDQQNLFNISQGIIDNDFSKAAASNVDTQAMNLMNSQNSANLSAYQASEQAKHADYLRQRQYMQDKPVSVRDIALKLGGATLGYTLGGPFGATLGMNILGGNSNPSSPLMASPQTPGGDGWFSNAWNALNRNSSNTGQSSYMTKNLQRSS